MKNTFLIVYTVIVAIILGIVFFVNPSDFVTMLLFGFIVILTSIYTYSTRHKQ